MFNGPFFRIIGTKIHRLVNKIDPKSVKLSKTARCSFCNRTENEVKELCIGPTVNICNDCTEVLNEILEEGK